MQTRLILAATAAVILIPNATFAAALTLGPTFPGQFNGGSLAVGVNGNGVTTGCIDFYSTALPDGCTASATFQMNQPIDPTVFAYPSVGTIVDIPAPGAPISHFITLPGQVGGNTIYLDFLGISMPTPIPCPPAMIPGTCAIGDFVFGQNSPNSVTVGFTANARGYTGTPNTGFTPYVITFSSPFSGTTIANMIATIQAGGTITNAVSFNAVPSGPSFTGCSVTQGGWGAAPNGGNSGALLAAKFPTVYPLGVTIGSTAPGQFFLHFDHAANIQGFMPQGGPPGALNASATDPTSRTSAGVFAGQVLALQLNADIDGLGGLILTGTGTSLDGSTVSQILAAANRALGGGPLPFGFTYSSLNDLVNNLNQSFDGCVAGSFSGHLK